MVIAALRRHARLPLNTASCKSLVLDDSDNSVAGGARESVAAFETVARDDGQQPTWVVSRCWSAANAIAVAPCALAPPLGARGQPSLAVIAKRRMPVLRRKQGVQTRRSLALQIATSAAHAGAARGGTRAFRNPREAGTDRLRRDAPATSNAGLTRLHLGPGT